MKNIGKFYVSKELNKESSFSKVLSLLRFVPLRVEYLAYRNAFEYIGLSPYFENSENCEPAEYGITVNKTYVNEMDKEGQMTINVEKVN